MRTVSTALFLACSWLWCLGGFFPVLLIHDFGHEAFAFFLVFNVLGAMAFGFVWDDERRRAFLLQHPRAPQWFSLVVVGYHAVFVFWIAGLLGNALLPLVFLGCTAALWGLRRRLFGIAVGLFAVTLVMFAIAADGPMPVAMVAPQSASAIHVMLPMALGFALAPYFDLTFHRAFAHTSSPRLSFALGFGLAFCLLLLGIYVFAGTLGELLERPLTASSPLLWVVAMLVLQWSFTTAAHLHEITAPQALPRRTAVMGAVTVAVLILAHLVVGLFAPELSVDFGILVYKTFIFVIGGLFPLLLLFRWDRRYVVAGAVLISPCYGLGFLVGGAWAPMLSVAMIGLVLLALHQTRSEMQRPFKA